MNIKNKIIVFLSLKIIIFIFFVFFVSFYKMTPSYLCTLMITKIDINKENNKLDCYFYLAWNEQELTTKKIIEEAKYLYFPKRNIYWNLNEKKLTISRDNKIVIENENLECQNQNEVIHLKLKKITFLKYFLTKIIN